MAAPVRRLGVTLTRGCGNRSLRWNQGRSQGATHRRHRTRTTPSERHPDDGARLPQPEPAGVRHAPHEQRPHRRARRNSAARGPVPAGRRRPIPCAAVLLGLSPPDPGRGCTAGLHRGGSHRLLRAARLRPRHCQRPRHRRHLDLFRYSEAPGSLRSDRMDRGPALAQRPDAFWRSGRISLLRELLHMPAVHAKCST